MTHQCACGGIFTLVAMDEGTVIVLVARCPKCGGLHMLNEIRL